MGVERYAALADASAARWSAALGVTVPTALVLAVMQRENPAANPAATYRERDGELSRGLMMVKDSTARDMGLDDPALLAEPAIGVDVGTGYLARKLVQYGGSIPQAVAAYNAGTARYTEEERFINQGYVDAVLGFFQRFMGAGTHSAGGAGGVTVGQLLIVAALALVAVTTTAPGLSRAARRRRRGKA